MTPPDHRKQTEKPFLNIEDAEIVHGPDVIAGKVSEALVDADRFDLPTVEPPLSKALEEIERLGLTGGGKAGGEPQGQDALSGTPSDVDETAGSADLLEPATGRQS